MFAAMQAHGITPLVTVNHYVLPLWVHDGVACHADPDGCTANGWVDGDRMVPLIALFTGWVGREFGGEVDGWVTLNEPLATSLAGYLQPGEDRSAPPVLTLDGARTVAVTIHQVEGHAAMYDALHQWDAEDADGDGVVVDVGIVMNMVAITPRDPDRPEDLEAVAHADHIYHRLFLSALTSGDWDDDLDGTFDAVRPDLAGRLDWIGVNYYNELRVGFTGLQLLPEIPAFDFLPEFSWEPFPEGIASALEVAASYELPIVITENGSPQVDDADAILSGHLRATWDAMQDGADVRGYHYWSWVDNYEWNHGFDLRFGLNALEADKSRTPRPVMGRLTEIIEANGLD
jgi:beta-glucosidase/6-phospho-beta-glucosidase/beta-galactosidase